MVKINPERIPDLEFKFFARAVISACEKAAEKEEFWKKYEQWKAERERAAEKEG